MQRIFKNSFATISRQIPKLITPVSDGSGPTPVPVYHQGARRTGLIALKKGMTTLWDEFGQMIPVTVLKVKECNVLGTRYHSGCGSYMLQVGAVNHPKLHRVKRPQLFHYRKFKVQAKRKLKEYKISPDASIPSGIRFLMKGFQLRATHFVPGQFVDVQAKTVGKGFQGVMKRWGFKGGRASHGNSLKHRAAGSIGQCQDPGKVWKGKKMAGRMGGVYRTVQSLKVVKIDTAHDLIYVKGAVPGVDNAYVSVSDAIRKSWHGKCFPAGAQVPFPTYFGSSEVERELCAPIDEKAFDPFARTRREKP
ncbi:54S ribosomal protein L3 [Boothiomyces sp. JEL0838]|nr:54S ribosomal protein L3 [Boothiomyces sp. JEL0838]